MQTDLLTFLTKELSTKGIDASDAEKSLLPIRTWSLQRDDYGFVIIAPAQAHSRLKTYLDAVFAKPKFDDHPTLIYRNDEQHTTVMLNKGTEKTELIVLFWRDAVVRSRIADAQSRALEQTVNGVVAEVQQLLDHALAEKDEIKQAALLEEAQRKCDEVGAALDPSTGEHDQDL